jgi:hypothetical protein
MSDEAKAVKEVTKAIGKGIDAAREVGGFLGDLCGPFLQDAIGLVHDRLRYYRAGNLLRLREKYKQAIEKRGIKSTQAIPPHIALPIFEAAAIEEDESLRELWANLLASAADPQFEGSVRRCFIDMARQLDPSDAVAFTWAYHQLRKRQDKAPLNVTEIIEHAKSDPSTSGPIIDNLIRVNVAVQSVKPALRRLAFSDKAAAWMPLSNSDKLSATAAST